MPNGPFAGNPSRMSSDTLAPSMRCARPVAPFTQDAVAARCLTNLIYFQTDSD